MQYLLMIYRNEAEYGKMEQDRSEGARLHRRDICTKADYFAATAVASAGRLASSACKVASVERSATPSTRAGRK